VELELALEERVLDERVDDEVEPHSRAPAVDRPVAQDHRAEAAVLQGEELLLAVSLRLGIGALGDDRGALVVHPRRQPVVQRARRREHEPLDAPLHARAAERLGRERGSSASWPRVVFGGRVVRQAGEVDHAVDPVEGGRRDLAHVGRHQLNAVTHRRERLLAPVEPVSTRTR